MAELFPIKPIDSLTSIPEDARCQEASVFSTTAYIPCGAPAYAIVDSGDSRPYYMCRMCTAHNVQNRGAKIIYLDTSRDVQTYQKDQR